MADLTQTMCPVCRARFLNPHCGSKSCPSWTKCPGSHAVIDVRHRRGFRNLDPARSPVVYVPVEWPGPEQTGDDD
jgi:hypothetical protein